MKGGTRKRGTAWSYYFDLGKVNGKRRKVEKGGFRTKKEAEAALSAAMVQYENAGQLFTPSEITLSDYFDEWYELYCLPNLAYNSRKTYKHNFDKHIRPELGSYKLRSLTPATIQAYILKMQKKGYSRKTLSMYLGILEASLNYAVEPMRYISDTPCRHIEIPKAAKKARKRELVPIDNWHKIMELYPSGNRYHIPLMIGFYCGMRISEVCGLTWEDIDLDARTITVSHQILNETGVGWFLSKPKTEKSERKIIFGDTLLQELKQERALQHKNEAACGSQYYVQVFEECKDSAGDIQKRIFQAKKENSQNLPRLRMVCINNKGQMTTPKTFSTCSSTIKNTIGSDFDFHSLRHTHASMLIQAGASIKDVQDRIGHKDVQTTLNTYVHTTHESQVATANIFEKAAATTA